MKKIILKTVFLFGFLFVLSNVVFASTPAITVLQSYRNRDPIGHAIFAGLGAVLVGWIISNFNKNKTNKYIRNVLSDTDQFRKTIFRTYSNLILLPNEQENEDKISAENLNALIDSYIEVIKEGNKVTFEEYIEYIKKTKSNE
ncbi:MAG: hypothetical protein LBP63_03470 [Prevotellaceae bacterium]|jgi:hypothetical protein|nr:hypothetical protein [Prevotellaceae bacterium]